MKAAISAGADAVYLGGSRFGARHFAANFDDSTLRDAVDYAHIRGVKIYVTVNTLIHDSEIDLLGSYLHYLFVIGVDALLIQDAGVLAYAQYLYSGLTAPSLHASTQMTIHNREGAVYACNRGCKRIVLARELTIPEIRDIAESVRKYRAEVEIFVHGALCYAYSGQCLLSSVIGGRSGNRGMCAQPCRKPYQLFRGVSDEYGRLISGVPVSCEGEFLMSTRDLSTYQVLPDIVSLPIAALKIEGRMRSVTYVAIVTRIYRRALDAIRDRSFLPSREDEIALALAFSRGFTTGYLNGEMYQRVMGRTLPGRRGLLVGSVLRGDTYGLITLTSSGDILPCKGDGLVCISGHDELGFILRKDVVMKGGRMEMEATFRCQKGDRIFLTSSVNLNRYAEKLLQNPDQRFNNSIPLEISMIISQDGGVHISGDAYLKNGRIVSHSFVAGQVFAQARSQPVTGERIGQLLRKTGGTLFMFKSLQITCPDGLFAPISHINEIRREIIEQFTDQILTSFRPGPDDCTLVTERIAIKNSSRRGCSPMHKNPADMRVMVIVSDSYSLEAAYHSGAERIYVEWYPAPSQRNEAEKRLLEILDCSLMYPDAGERVGIKIPRIIRREELDYLYTRLPDIIQSGITHILVDGIGIAENIRRSYGELVISAYSGLNITNHYALSSYQDYGFLTLSVELSGGEILTTMQLAYQAGITTPVAVIGQGLIEAMITEDRLCELSGDHSDRNEIFGLRDQKGLIFPVISDPVGRTHIFNAAETSLIDQIPSIRSAGIGIIILDTRWRGKKYTADALNVWKEACSIPDSCWTIDKGIHFKDTLKKMSSGNMTSATWKRGLSRIYEIL